MIDGRGKERADWVIAPPSLEVREGSRKPDEEEEFGDQGMIHGLSAPL